MERERSVREGDRQRAKRCEPSQQRVADCILISAETPRIQIGKIVKFVRQAGKIYVFERQIQQIRQQTNHCWQRIRLRHRQTGERQLLQIREFGKVHRQRRYIDLRVTDIQIGQRSAIAELSWQRTVKQLFVHNKLGQIAQQADSRRYESSVRLNLTSI